MVLDQQNGEQIRVFWPAENPGDRLPAFDVTITPDAHTIAREHGLELARPWPVSQAWVTEEISGTTMTGWLFTYATWPALGA